MTAAEMIIAAAAKRGSAVNEERVKAVLKLVEDAQREFEEQATLMAMTSQGLERAYSL
ncbi:hypothetical protein ACFONN_10315 [Dyella humi]|uniref:Uncharacterized protein n=1 Tax=Dyella humi TaxID=1770547 RepID=A0ABW8IJL0_9GAMM